MLQLYPKRIRKPELRQNRRVIEKSEKFPRRKKRRPKTPLCGMEVDEEEAASTYEYKERENLLFLRGVVQG